MRRHAYLGEPAKSRGRVSRLPTATACHSRQSHNRTISFHKFRPCQYNNKWLGNWSAAHIHIRIHDSFIYIQRYINTYMAVDQYSCFRKTPSSREKKFLSRIFRDSIATPFCLQRALWSHCGCCSCACKHGSRSSLACST